MDFDFESAVPPMPHVRAYASRATLTAGHPRDCAMQQAPMHLQHLQASGGRMGEERHQSMPSPEGGSGGLLEQR